MNTLRTYLLFSLVMLLVQAGAAELRADGGTQARIEQAVNRWLEQTYGSDTYRFEVAVRWFPDRLEKIGSNENIIVSSVGEGVPRAYTNFTIRTSAEASVEGQIQVFVKTWQKLPVPKRTISAGERLQSQDFHVRWTALRKRSGPFVEEIPADPRFARRNLQAGRPVARRDLRKPVLVEAGDHVLLVIKQGGMMIKMQCTAREDGGKGDRIRLYSREVGKTYIGKIQNEEHVLWMRTR